jgi:thiamine-phosphate pyrophosphorylase
LRKGHKALGVKAAQIASLAAKLGRLAPKQKVGTRDLPRLWLVTDPNRLADPREAAAQLPPGSGIIYRGFGRPEADQEAMALAKLAKVRGLILLIGADAALAQRVGADGVHLPERLVIRARRIRARHQGWIVTAAAHSRAALARAQTLGLDAAFVSTVFQSLSPSAGAPLGPVKLAGWTRHSSLPIIALGGIDAKTGKRLIATGVYGLAAIEGLKT